MQNLPTTTDELHAEFARDVEALIRRKVKSGIVHDDAVGDVWLRLLSADVLGKFRASGQPQTRAQLRRYVLAAARNALANVFRTHARRFNSEFVRRAPDYSIDGEAFEPWEARLKSPAISPERFAMVMSDQRQRWAVRASMPE